MSRFGDTALGAGLGLAAVILAVCIGVGSCTRIAGPYLYGPRQQQEASR